MTWHLAAHGRAWAAVLTALFLTACGSSGSKRAQIELLAPEDMAELTIEDDQDPDLPGVQYEVRAQTKNIRPKTVMLLVIPGENNSAYFTEVDDEGLVIFEKATLPPGAHTFHISTVNSTVSSDEYSYTLKTLVIQSPRDGASIAFGDDTDQDTEGLQINVTVKAYAVDLNEDITLSVDGEQAGDAVSPDEEGVAVFRGVTLATGRRVLKVSSGDVESSETEVEVNEACASVTFVSPEVPADGDRVTLGGGDQCPASGEDFVFDFVISTDAGEGRDVELTVNNTTKQKSKVSGALARFEGVVLNRRMSANEVSVTVQGAGGVTCAPVPYPKDIFVDCDGSDCSIGSPVPYSGEDAGGDPAFYLNSSMLNGDGFDIRVDSDQGVIGKQLQLIIDGRDGRNALSSEAVPNGNRLSATFSKVQLTQGVHTIEARCTDGSGNVTESGELTWVIDTEACDVTISEPMANALIVPGNDADMDASNGLMLPVTASIEGSDCTGSRTATCNPTNGIANGDYSTIVNGSVETTVTLSSGADQTICVEARDRANNVGRGTAVVRYRSMTPSVSIEAPANDASYNKLGNDDHSADTDPNTAACNADFHVACTEVGGTVQLHRVDENGPVIASGMCEPHANGDPAIPSGFNGRAKIPNVAFLAPGADNATIVATQTLAGTSNQTLTGKSAPISLTGWCDLPQVGLTPNCPSEQIELPMSGNATINQNANFSGPIPDRAPETGTATVTDSGGSPIGGVVTATLAGTLYQFSGIDLGNAEQMVSVKFDFTDDYGNTTSRTCPVTLVSDLPVVTIDMPSTGAKFGPSGGCSPSPAAPDKYGVDVAIELDQQAMRTLGYRVNGGTKVDVTITGTNMNLCIPVSDGLSTISIELASTIGQGLSKPAVDVDVDMLNITSPAENHAFLPGEDACDPGFGATLSADVASAFEGAAFTVTGGASEVTGTVSGGEINTCVPVNPGANALTVSLDGKNVSRTVNVSVVGGAPTKSIPITTVNVPSGSSFRTGSVSLGWNTPEQDYPGQLTNYELRCGTTQLQMSDTDQAKSDWWAAARTISLSGGVVPPATSSTAGFRVGDNLHCVLRGKDAADQLTPIGASTQVNYSFREASIEVSELNRLGYAIAPVGDVNDDGVADVLIGGTGRAYLLFGGANVTSKTAPDVTFVGNSMSLATYEFGTRVAAIGDVNGDGTNDFAISHPTLSVTAPASVGYVGAVYVFYGRKSNDPWPTSIDLSGTSATACGADACFYGEETGELLGFAVAPAGDFNGDGRPDIAMSATSRGAVGRLYVLMGRAFQGGGSRPSSFWNVAIRLPSGAPVGFYVDGAGDTGTDATSSRLLGQGVTPVGNSDGMAGADLLVTSGGSSSPAYSAKLHLLSGRAHDGVAPQLKAIPTSDLVLKDTGAAGQFGRSAISLRNWYDSGSSGVPDAAIFYGSGTAFNVYLGDNTGGSTFSNSARITVDGGPNTGFANIGRNVAHGYNPNLGGGSTSDIDGDGLDDLCVGTVPASGTTPIFVFYGSDLGANLSSNYIAYSKASQINPTARAGATSRTVQPVGDITGDGKVDVIVGEPNANSNSGGVTVLY